MEAGGQQETERAGAAHNPPKAAPQEPQSDSRGAKKGPGTPAPIRKAQKREHLRTHEIVRRLEGVKGERQISLY